LAQQVAGAADDNSFDDLSGLRNNLQLIYIGENDTNNIIFDNLNTLKIVFVAVFVIV